MKKTLKQLQQEEAKIREEINKREQDEIDRVQKPYLKSLVGHCYIYRDNSYGGDRPRWNVYRKILDWIDTKERGFHFIFEECSVDCDGKAELTVEHHYAYLNKAWHKEVPFSGWANSTEEEYLKAKEYVMAEMRSQEKMRKVLKEKYT